MKARTRFATVLLAWLLIIPIGALVPSQAADAAPEEDTLLATLDTLATTSSVEFGTRLSGGHAASAGFLSTSSPLLGGWRLWKLDKPDFRIWPNERVNQVVNLDSFMSLTDGYTPESWCMIPGFWGCIVWANTIPVGARFEFRELDTGARDTEDCWGPGLPWFFGQTDASGPFHCGQEWFHSSDVTGQVEVRARSLQWLFLNGFWAGPVKSRTSDAKTLNVGEVLNIGQTIALPVIAAPESTGDGGGLCSVWGVSVVCWVGREAADLALEAIYAITPVLREVAAFFEGCADAVIDAAGGLVNIIRELGELIKNPGEFVNEKIQEFKDLIEAVKEDPEAFVTEALADILELDKLKEEGGANWVGTLICKLAIEYFTGKAADTIVRAARTWLRDRRDGPNGPDCLVSSFPGETLVVMADGTLERIDAINPGDRVLSHNVDTSVWEPGLVLDQWSHVDRGPPATATLTTSATITATDDHLFWQADAAQWVELQFLGAGDELLTPSGSIAIETVAVGDAQDWVVWELTVEDNHNFTVLAGDDPLLVHNGFRCQPNPVVLRQRSQETSDRLARDGLDVTPEEVTQAWQRYLADNPDADFDTWQGQYENIRRNNHLGNAHEQAILDKYGIDTKNGQTFPDPDGGTDFKPDAVISTDPPHFVEIKDYQNTTLYPGSNAGKQLKYINQHAIDNPGNPGTFDLHISDPSNISPGMQDLIDTARNNGVTVNINPDPGQ